MNYISEVNSFHSWVRMNLISGSAQALWHTLMHYNNQNAVKCGDEWLWKCEFRVPNKILYADLDMDRDKLTAARNVLIQKGRIVYKKGSGNQSGTYKLIPFDENLSEQIDDLSKEKVWKKCLSADFTTQSTTQNTTQDTTQSTTQNPRKDNSNHLIKVNSNNIINNNIISTEQKNDEQFSAPCFTLPMTGGENFSVTEKDIEYYESLYPACDVRQEFRKMIGWLDANPAKRKTPKGIKRFINAWLTKEQDKGGALKGKSNPVSVTDGIDWDEMEREAQKLREEGFGK